MSYWGKIYTTFLNHVYNTTSVISESGTFLPFALLVVLLLVVTSNFIVLGVKFEIIPCFNFKCNPIFYFIYI